MPPRVSVVMTAYNFSPFIRTALASVQRQTLRDIEIIVVDDCSTDSTPATVAAAAVDDPRIKPLRTEVNSGPCTARNIGIDAARGRWIAMMDGDDAYHPRRLESLLASAERRDADVIADNTLFYDHESWQPRRLLFSPGLFEHVDWLSIEEFMRWAQWDRVPHLGWLKPMMRRSFLNEHQIRYAQGLGRGEDFLILFACLAAGARLALLPDSYYFARQRPGSVSRPIKLQPGYWNQLLDCNSMAIDIFGCRDNREVQISLERQRRIILAILTFDDLMNELALRNVTGVVSAGARLATTRAAYIKYSKAIIRKLSGLFGDRPVFDPAVLRVLDDLRERELAQAAVDANVLP